MTYARLIRGDILSTKERDYVMAARVIGVKDSRILFRHILPNAIFPTMVYASLAIGDVVLGFAALSFLGVGTEIGYADWGQVLSFARNLDHQPEPILVYRGLAWFNPGVLCDGLEPAWRCLARHPRPAHAWQILICVPSQYTCPYSPVPSWSGPAYHRFPLPGGNCFNYRVANYTECNAFAF
jgi:hypothetical protein